MMDQSPFPNEPDRELGSALRAALDGPDSAAFLAKVRYTVEAATLETPMDALVSWAPRGLAAAMLAAALGWLLLAPRTPEPMTGPIASAPVQMEVSPGQSEAIVLTVALLEGR